MRIKGTYNTNLRMYRNTHKGHLVLLRYDGLGMWLRRGTQEMHKEFWWGNLLDISCLEDREGYRRILLK